MDNVKGSVRQCEAQWYCWGRVRARVRLTRVKFIVKIRA